jgi:hypothetical protein
MFFSRRHVLATFAAAPFTLIPFTPTSAQNPASDRRRPDGSQDASGADSSAPGNFPPSANKAMLEERQKNIKKDVERLYNLAEQLKSEVEKTDSTTILSLAMVKKAEEIEKLAKQIKDRAKR